MKDLDDILTDLAAGEFNRANGIASSRLDTAGAKREIKRLLLEIVGDDSRLRLKIEAL